MFKESIMKFFKELEAAAGESLESLVGKINSEEVHELPSLEGHVLLKSADLEEAIAAAKLEVPEGVVEKERREASKKAHEDLEKFMLKVSQIGLVKGKDYDTAEQLFEKVYQQPPTGNDEAAEKLRQAILENQQLQEQHDEKLKEMFPIEDYNKEIAKAQEMMSSYLLDSALSTYIPKIKRLEGESDEGFKDRIEMFKLKFNSIYKNSFDFKQGKGTTTYADGSPVKDKDNPLKFLTMDEIVATQLPKYLELIPDTVFRGGGENTNIKGEAKMSASELYDQHVKDGTLTNDNREKVIKQMMEEERAKKA